MTANCKIEMRTLSLFLFNFNSEAIVEINYNIYKIKLLKIVTPM